MLEGKPYLRSMEIWTIKGHWAYHISYQTYLVLITWIAVVVTILAIMGLGWNVFVSGVYKGVQKIMGNSTILKKMTEKAQQLVGNITKNGSEEKILKRPASNIFNSNLNV